MQIPPIQIMAFSTIIILFTMLQLQMLECLQQRQNSRKLTMSNTEMYFIVHSYECLLVHTVAGMKGLTLL